jgi:hypothetical protein
MILLGEALRAFELEEVEVSDHDILHGGALRLAGVDSGASGEVGATGIDDRGVGQNVDERGLPG